MSGEILLLSLDLGCLALFNHRRSLGTEFEQGVLHRTRIALGTLRLFDFVTQFTNLLAEVFVVSLLVGTISQICFFAVE